MESLNNNDLESNNRKIDEIEESISKALLYDDNKKDENICNNLIPHIIILLGISVIVIVIVVIV